MLYTRCLSLALIDDNLNLQPLVIELGDRQEVYNNKTNGVAVELSNEFAQRHLADIRVVITDGLAIVSLFTKDG